jgi:serine/threonine protein kinase
LLGQLEHEHLVAVLDSGMYLGKTPYLVMEYLDGRTLRQVILEGAPLTWEDIATTFIQAAHGLAYVHGKGIVHRDLKPANLMLTKRADGHASLKIIDFGIARETNEGDDPLTRSGAELGTAQYMSPEQARGAGHIDARSDVYSFGAILYETLSGKRVHPGGSYNEVIFHLLTQRHVPFADLTPNCPERLLGIVERCLEKEPSRRYADGGEVATALSELVVQRPSSTGIQHAIASRRESRMTPLRHGVIPWVVGGMLVGAGLNYPLIAFRPGSPWSRHERQDGSPPADLLRARVEPSPCSVDARASPNQRTTARENSYELADTQDQWFGAKRMCPRLKNPEMARSAPSPRSASRDHAPGEGARAFDLGSRSSTRAPVRMASNPPMPVETPDPQIGATHSPDPGREVANIATGGNLPFATTNPYGGAQ